MKRGKYVLILAIISVVTILGMAGCNKNNYDQEKLVQLATCLADNGAKEYGAFWCPHCAEQAKVFGDADSIIKDRNVYTECDPRCVPGENGNIIAACRGAEGHPTTCLEKGVQGYPTWEFSDGSFLSGVQDPQILSDRAGCNIDFSTE